MRPHGHSTGSFHAERAESREKLQDIPDAKEDHRWDGDGEDKDEGKNARPGIEQNVSPHHSGYGPARTDGGNRGM